MDTTRYFSNENLKARINYLFWLLVAVAGLLGFQFLNPIIKPNRYSGSITEWVFTGSVITILIIYFLFHKRFVSIAFEDSSKKITLTTTTLINGVKINEYLYADISFKTGKHVANFRKRATLYIELYKNTDKLIRLERDNIGEYAFDSIHTELLQLKYSTG